MPRKKRDDTEYGFEQRVEEFAEEIEELGEKIGAWFEERVDNPGWHGQRDPHGSREQRKYHKSHDQELANAFGLLGPFISALIGVLILCLIVWGMEYVNVWMGSALLADIHVFLTTNMSLLFLLMVLSSYNTYLSEAYPKTYQLLSPVATAIGVAVSLWLLVVVMNISNHYVGIDMLSTLSFYIENSIYIVFWMVILVGYLVLLSKYRKNGKMSR